MGFAESLHGSNAGVIHNQLVSSRDEIGCHTAAHLSKTNEADLR